eukprot:gene21002-15739_t
MPPPKAQRQDTTWAGKEAVPVVHTQTDGPLKFGDKVSLYSRLGFLSTLGNVDERVVVEPMAGNLSSVPIKYRDCMFKICPQNRYMALEQYNREKNAMDRGGSDGGGSAVMLQQLKVAAMAEQEVNRKETNKLWGTPVQYGFLVQLLHVKSNKYLTTHRRLTAVMERHALRLTLSRSGNEGSWFQIETHYKHRE